MAYVITGVNNTGRTYPRLEIRDLAAKPEQFSLFIQAWINIRNPAYQPLAAQFVQLGGIHGLPYTPWPGDPNGAPSVGAPWGGYCNHESVAFPTWHRPYIMALEQSICREAQLVLKTSKTDPLTVARWAQAAEELRFPFWDWTSPDTGTKGLPSILYDKTLTLQMPDGTTRTVENILAYYDFGSKAQLPAGFQNIIVRNPVVGDAGITAYFAEWTRTYRWPDGAQQNVVENYARLNSTLTNPDSHTRGSYLEMLSKVAQLFSYPQTDSRGAIIWDQFSNTRGQSKPTHNFNLAALEQPHNTIHLVMGGSGGAMMDNSYAGFDPIFYLHHCNVDRLLAFWEYVYPSYWMGKDGFETPNGREQFIQPGGTFSEPNNSVINEASSLTPYRKADGNYWTSNDTHSLEKQAFPKYYTYPPIRQVSVDQPATPAQRAKYLAILQMHFGYTPTVFRDSEPIIKQRLYAGDNESALPRAHEPVFKFRQFVINVEVVEHAFNGSYFLEVLYTAKDGKTYGVGATAVLGNSSGTMCEGCTQRQLQGSKVHDSIHVPHHIAVKIITDHDLNHERVTDDELCNTILSSFHAQVVTPEGTPHARAVRGERAGGRAPPLDEAIAPKLQLASANVSAIKDDNPIHVWQFYDWKSHGSILDHEWVAGN